jgi:hypothetical protein
MTKTEPSNTGIPEGFLALPVTRQDRGSCLRLCVLVRSIADPATGAFLVLRDMHDAVVYLGCFVDAGGRARQWTELWVQNVDGLHGSLPSYHESFSNYALDQRWRKQAESLKELAPDRFVDTGWEQSHPLPSFLDLVLAESVNPGSDTPEGPWVLCSNDSVLRAEGLPPFSTSLFRYLYQPGNQKIRRFIPIVAGAPENQATCPLAAALDPKAELLAFNPQGGLITVLSFSPLGFDEHVDLLGGKPWKGLGIGKKPVTLDDSYETLGDWNSIQQSEAHLFCGKRGFPGRLVETLHLKLQLLREVFRLTHQLTERLQLPFLNLGADSFRVSLENIGSSLPFLWTAKVSLVKPSCAFVLPVETSDFRYFVRGAVSGPSIYLPEGLSAPMQGIANVRIRKLLPPDQDRTVLEGTLVLEERIAASPHDLLWIRLPLKTGRLDLYGHIYATESLAQGEARFRTIPQKLAPEIVSALRSNEGVSFTRSAFEVVPLLSSPCDLYSLAVLVVRTLLVNQETTLAVSLDESLSLARQAAVEYNKDVPLAARIRAICEREPRYLSSLGSHRLVEEPMKPEDAQALLPQELWYDVLGLLITLFPGIGPDSVCRDFGDVPSLALESVFTQPIAKLQRLWTCSRSLIVIDWNYNRQIHSAIREVVSRNSTLDL